MAEEDSAGCRKLKRYRGEPVPPGSKLAIIVNDAIGNFVVSTALLAVIRREWRPAKIVFFSGDRVSEFLDVCSLVDEWLPLFGGTPFESTAILNDGLEKFDIVVNLESTPLAVVAAGAFAKKDGFVIGPCLDSEGRGPLLDESHDRDLLLTDPQWLREDFLEKYPFASSQFIGDIFCSMAHLPPTYGYFLPTESPQEAPVDVVLSTSASLASKTWPHDKWMEISRRLLKKGLRLGIVGAKPSYEAKYWVGSGGDDQLIGQGVEDLRGKMSLPQLAGFLKMSGAIVGIDNGVLHIAAGVGITGVGLYRQGFDRLWKPPFSKIKAICPEIEGEVSEIEVEVVWRSIESKVLSNR